MQLNISVTVPPIETLELISPTQVHIVSNTGKQLETTFTINNTTYTLTNCDLTAGHYIDTICTLEEVE